jgi:hypothetical protein
MFSCYPLRKWQRRQTAHYRLIFKVQKPVETLILTQNYPFLSKYLSYISGPRDLAGIIYKLKASLECLITKKRLILINK